VWGGIRPPFRRILSTENIPTFKCDSRIPNAPTGRANAVFASRKLYDDFQKSRADLNEEILGCGHLGIKRFFALDHQAYEPGPLGTKTKELLGLVASAVLRCDDCITYHLVRCGEEGWKREEVIDALNVALVVGGSITIPHVRRAFARMREIDSLRNS
jgi:AhpD family alkylhydroperoxidase